MMKYITILLTLFSFSASAQQIAPPVGSPNTLNRYKGGLIIDSMIKVPTKDTTAFFTQKGDLVREKTSGRLYYLNENNEYKQIGSTEAGNGTLIMNTTGIATGSATFTANQTGNSTFTVTTPSFGNTAGTVAQGNDSRINNGQMAYTWGNHALAGYENQSNKVTNLLTPNNITYATSKAVSDATKDIGGKSMTDDPDFNYSNDVLGLVYKYSLTRSNGIVTATIINNIPQVYVTSNNIFLEKGDYVIRVKCRSTTSTIGFGFFGSNITILTTGDLNPTMSGDWVVKDIRFNLSVSGNVSYRFYFNTTSSLGDNIDFDYIQIQKGFTSTNVVMTGSDLQNFVDKTDIGGKSLTPDGDFNFGSEDYTVIQTTLSVSNSILKITKFLQSANARFAKTIYLQPGQYVLRVKCRSTTASIIFNASAAISTESNTIVNPNLTGSWIEKEFKFNVNTAGSYGWEFRVGTTGNIGDYMEFDYIQLQNGNKSTNLVYSPKDLQSDFAITDTNAIGYIKNRSLATVGELFQTITGQTSQTFTLSQPINTSKHLMVILNAAWVDPIDYTISGSTITFSFPIAASDRLNFYYKSN